MNIHEYQAKAILKAYGAAVADGVMISDAERSARRRRCDLPGPVYVVKSADPCRRARQGTLQGARCRTRRAACASRKSVDEVERCASEMLGKTLVTQQTGPAGKRVNRLYIEDGADIARELYLSLLVDRARGRVAFVASTEGGMDIEKVAATTPEKIVTVAIDPTTGVRCRSRTRSLRRSKLEEPARSEAKPLFAVALRRLPREGHEPARGQSADRH